MINDNFNLGTDIFLYISLNIIYLVLFLGFFKIFLELLILKLIWYLPHSQHIPQYHA